MAKNTETSERISLLNDSPTKLYLIKRHKFAYHFALKYAANLRVLDYGCGEGYGAKMLSATAESVCGYDRNKSVIIAASKKYHTKGLCYTSNIKDISGKFNVITAFQVIEHVKNDAGFLKKINSLLENGGVAIITTPNSKLRSIDGRPRNKFHVREYDLKQITKLAKNNTSEYKILGINGNFRTVVGEKIRMKEVNPGYFAKALYSKGDIFKKYIRFKVGKPSDKSIDFIILVRR